jgi:hypothetical protein
LDNLAEWTELKTKLSSGLKPFEAVEVELPVNTGLKALRQSFKNRVDAYLKKLNLTDYEVMSYRTHGKEYVSVAYSITTLEEVGVARASARGFAHKPVQTGAFHDAA